MLPQLGDFTGRDPIEVLLVSFAKGFRGLPAKRCFARVSPHFGIFML